LGPGIIGGEASPRWIATVLRHVKQIVNLS
jgi:hypothetical protein